MPTRNLLLQFRKSRTPEISNFLCQQFRSLDFPHTRSSTQFVAYRSMFLPRGCKKQCRSLFWIGKSEREERIVCARIENTSGSKNADKISKTRAPSSSGDEIRIINHRVLCSMYRFLFPSFSLSLSLFLFLSFFFYCFFALFIRLGEAPYSR